MSSIFKLTYLSLAAVLIAALPLRAADEPQWLHPWQHELEAWLKSLTPADLTAEIVPVDPAELKDLNDVFAASQGYGNMLVSKTAGVIAIPAEAFTWQQIWRSDLPLEQAALKDAHHGLASGQIWLPSHPTAANWLAWAYANEASWNSYRDNANVARRAAVISIVDLLMQAENTYHYGDPESSRDGRRYGIHQGIMGFTLTFNTMTLLKVQEVLPEEVRSAWKTGLKYLFSETVTRPATGPANMRISLPVALYYAYLATHDPDYLTWYRDWEAKTVFGNTWDPAGVYIDGGAPDASYNGIALHRVAELYAINPSDKLGALLDQAYTLRNYMSLPEPDGHLLAPSHFNDRCASSFPNDQYQGREVIFALDVPSAIPALAFRWRMLPTDVLKGRIVRDSAVASKRAVEPHPWGTVRVHNWQPVFALPYAMYHQSIPELVAAMETQAQLPVETETRYTRSFNDQFFVVRRPGYAAIFYAGPVSGSDQGRTNYRNMLSDRGGMFNGFAGGGLSAFWVEGGGSLLLGRMNQYENYERQTVALDWGDYQIPGWQDWMNNHLIGQTTEGKIITSARCSNPVGELAENGNSLTIRGTVPNEMKRQGELFEGSLAYERHYTFGEQSLDARLTVTADQPLSFQSLYESLPVRITDETELRFLDAAGDPIVADGETVPSVSRLQVHRGEAGAEIVFPAPVTLALLGQKTKSRQAGPAVYIQTVHIVLPPEVAPQAPVRLAYTLRPLP